MHYTLTQTFKADEKDDLLYCLHGLDFLLAISEVDEQLRDMQKYQDKNDISIDDMRAMIRESMRNYHVSLDMLL